MCVWRVGGEPVLKALITGAAGFIGQYVTKAFLAAGHEVVALDGLTYAGDANRLAGTGAEVVYHDLRAPIGELVDGRLGRIDVAVHLAADSHVDRSIARPVDVASNNFLAGLNFLEWARARLGRVARHGPHKVIVVSTDEVFGPARDGARHDEFAAYRPSNPYAASKAAVDALSYSYWRTYGLPYIGTHAMNNFGPGQHEEKFIPKACRHLLQGIPVPVHAREGAFGWEPGSRTWIHAEDTARALLFLSEFVEPVFYHAKHDPLRFNIVGEWELGNDQVVRKVAEVLGVEPLIDYVDVHTVRPGHDMRYSLDRLRLAALGWKTGDFNKQFRDTVLSFREQHERDGGR